MLYPKNDPQGQIQAEVFRRAFEKLGWTIRGDTHVLLEVFNGAAALIAQLKYDANIQAWPDAWNGGLHPDSISPVGITSEG